MLSGEKHVFVFGATNQKYCAFPMQFLSICEFFFDDPANGPEQNCARQAESAGRAPHSGQFDSSSPRTRNTFVRVEMKHWISIKPTSYGGE